MGLNHTDIAKIRTDLGLTQADFSKRFKIPLGTLASWEQGTREPHEASAVYIRLIQQDPNAMAKQVAKLDADVVRLKLDTAA